MKFIPVESSLPKDDDNCGIPHILSKMEKHDRKITFPTCVAKLQQKLTTA